MTDKSVVIKMSADKAVIIDNVVHGPPSLLIPGHLSFGQYLLDNFKENCVSEDRIALIDGETRRQITYRQLLQDVVNVATGLKKLGVKRGDVVALCSENRIEFMTATIGAICCGATITTAHTQCTKDEMLHILNISRPSIIFCSELALKLNLKTLQSVGFIKKIIQFDGTPLAEGIISYSSMVLVQANVNEYIPEEVQGWSDVAFILHSSGTTGLPKGVMLTHLNVLYTALNNNRDKHMERSKLSSRTLILSPWFHAMGLMFTLDYLALGKLIVFLTGFQPQKYLSTIQEYKIQQLILVPPIVVFLAKSPIVEKYDLSSVHTALCGAAPISTDTIDLAMKRMPNCRGIMQGYGMTEVTLVATLDVHAEDERPRSGSVGFPIPGSRLKVIDLETGKNLGPNQKGEIRIKGPVVMKGYAGNEEATRNSFDEEGYIKSGDIGYYDEDGYFRIVDRLKELIKYKGVQVPPAEVENVVMKHPGVAECGVVGIPDEKAGELPTAFVVRKPGINVTEQELIEFTDSRLSKYKRLHGGIIFVNEIPKNPSGKILRRVLREQLKKKRNSKL